MTSQSPTRFREKAKIFLLTRLFRWIMGLLMLSCRIKWHGKDKFDRHYNGDKAWILGCWHENVLIMPWLLPNPQMTCMVSNSRHGEAISRVLSARGMQLIRGSTSKGATKATRAALKVLRNKRPVAITPDGPRGPAHSMQSGILWLAAIGKVPIIALHIEVERHWRTRSWDGQKLPQPFSTIHVSITPPVMIDRDELEKNQEKVRTQFQQIMLDNVEYARQAAGYPDTPI